MQSKKPTIKKIKFADTSLFVQSAIQANSKKKFNEVLFYDDFYLHQFGPLHGDAIKQEYEDRYNFIIDILTHVYETYDFVESINDYKMVDGGKANIVIYKNSSDDICITFEFGDNIHAILTDLNITKDGKLSKK